MRLKRAPDVLTDALRDNGPQGGLTQDMAGTGKDLRS